MRVAVQTDDLTTLLRNQILNFKPAPSQVDVGEVVEIGDGIALVSGLRGAMAGELLEFTKNGILGIALNLNADSVGIIIMGEYQDIEEGDLVRSTGRIASAPVGDAMIGRVVNAVGLPQDGKGPIETDEYRNVERIAPGVIMRQPVTTPVQTGISAVDALIPIGRGQRELIIGDRQTGKTAIAIDTIINQKGQDLICIYVAIGQKQSSVAQVVATLAAPYMSVVRRDYLDLGKITLILRSLVLWLTWVSQCPFRRKKPRRMHHSMLNSSTSPLLFTSRGETRT